MLLSDLIFAQARGGVLSTDDLAAHSSTAADPVSVVYRGVRVWELPPNTQGLVALAALGTLGHLRDDSPGWFDGVAPVLLPIPAASAGGGVETPSPLARLRAAHPARYFHLIIEALRFAFSDARSIIADPDTSGAAPAQLTADKLLSEAHSKGRFASIDPRRATADVTSGSPPAYMSSDTISVSGAHASTLVPVRPPIVHNGAAIYSVLPPHLRQHHNPTASSRRLVRRGVRIHQLELRALRHGNCATRLWFHAPESRRGLLD